MATWRPLETYAPFARELAAFMWEARPPLNPNQFADRVGIRRQLLSNWLNSPPDARIAPEPAVLLRLARVMGRPVGALFVLAGHTTPDDPLLDRADAWAYVTREVARALVAENAGRVPTGYRRVCARAQQYRPSLEVWQTC
jgi:transcriptional regulator with XRE-family HTH domain